MARPTLAKPTLAKFSVIVFWPNFLNPKNPTPKDFFPNLGEGADPSGPHPSGPTYSGFWRCCGCWSGLPWTTFRRTPPSLRWTRMLDFDQLAEIELAEVENKLAEVEIGRSRNWPKSNRWCLFCFFFFCFFLFSSLSFLLFVLFLFLSRKTICPEP